MSAPKDEEPFHMQDTSENTSDTDEPILIPDAIDVKEVPEMPGVRRVDIGSMKAKPGIGMWNRLGTLLSIYLLTRLRRL